MRSILLAGVLLSLFVEVRADEQGFTPLFDGHSFAGWIGGPERFEIADGVLVSKQGCQGNMLTEREYGDFVLRFDFRLNAGGNSGLGIRVPLEGAGAYDGIELQILDDTADKYRDLKPYQFHGSAYGIAPAKRGALYPVGQWNRQEIRCRGSTLRVILNDQTILDVNLDQVAPNGKTIDGWDHPGLGRRTGHLAILCHEDVVEFRNLRIKELEEVPAGE